VCSASRGRYTGATHPIPLGSAPAPPCPCPKIDTPAQDLRRLADAALLAAFHAHQRRDKGFGAAAGPDAPDALSDAFNAAGYAVQEGDSAWRLTAGDEALIGELAGGLAAAAGETAQVDAPTVAAWRAVSRTGAVVGHADTLAIPSRFRQD